MSDTITIDQPVRSPEPADGRPSRDAHRAVEAAQEMLERARIAAEAVAKFHDAADRMDAARAAIDVASADRGDALRQMRDNGMTIVQIRELTGLSDSRIQAILRADS